MTKQLLTALLITALSATAQAEQWLCKGEEIVTWGSEVRNPEIESVTFVLEIERTSGQESISMKGDIGALIVNNPDFYGGSVSFDEGYYVRASDYRNTVSLNKYGKLVWTQANLQVLARVIFAMCDRL